MKKTIPTVDQFDTFFKKLLNSEKFLDYGPNGLQIEGVSHIQKMAFSVSADLNSIQKAIELKANALVVHHGILWSFHGARPITQGHGARVRHLIQNNINLFAYHLPLDAHPKIGNAACLALKLGLKNLKAFGDHKGSPLGVYGKFTKPILNLTLKDIVQKMLGHSILYNNLPPQDIQTMGIITGGAASNWVDCLKLGLDSYLTGEMSEHHYHESREAKVHMFAGGHHATERFGIMALKHKVEKLFKIPCFFIDSDNPA